MQCELNAMLRRLSRWIEVLLTSVIVAGGVVTSLHAQGLVEAPVLRIESGSHAGSIRRLAVDEARGLVVTASDDKSARVWDLRKGDLSHVLRVPLGAGEVGRLYGVAIHPSSGVVALGGTTSEGNSGHRIYLFDASSGRMTSSFDARAGHVKRLQWSADGSLLIAGYAGADGIKAFDASGRLVHEEAYDGAVYGLAVSRDGLLAATGADKRVRLYSARGGVITPLRSIQTEPAKPAEGVGRARAGVPWSASFSPDGKRLVVGFYGVGDPVRVYETDTGRLLTEFAVPRMEPGNQWAVAWSGDGKVVHAAGRLHRRGLAFPIFRHQAETGELLAEQAVARDSISDLVTLADGRVVYASQDGSWGVVNDRRVELASKASFADLRDASKLLAGGDLRQLAWTRAESGVQQSFDFGERTFQRRDKLRLEPAPDSLPGERNDVVNTYTPVVRGRRVELDRAEVSRAVVLLKTDGHAVLATSRGLRRIDDSGRVVWRENLPVEAVAVHASADARLLLAAMSDGTLRWYRASDGRHLLSFYPTADGQWIVWTPNGYFDASAGADRLIGWSVNRGADAAADFYSLGRFRSTFHRPDVIDQVFATLDVTAAIGRANELVAQANKDAARQEVKVAELPPALGLLESNIVRRSAASMVALPFTIRAAGTGGVTVEVRVNGRPVPTDQLMLPRELDGRERGVAQVAVADADAIIQLIARNRFGVSEPLSFRIEAPPAPVAAASPAVPSAAPAAAPATPPVAIAAAPSAAPARPTVPPAAAPSAAPTPSTVTAAASGTTKAGSSSATPAATPAPASPIAATPSSTTAAVTTPAAAATAPKSTVAQASPVAATSVPAVPAGAGATTIASATAAPTVVTPATAAPATAAPTATALTATATAAASPTASAPTATAAASPAATAPAAAATRAVAARPAAPRAKLVVFAIGISEYQRSEYRLGLAAKDARDFVKAMERQKGSLYSDVAMRVLTDREATRANIEQGLAWLSATVGPQDIGMLFMAGHGLNEPGGQYYFLPYDGVHNRLSATSVTESSIRDTLGKMRGRALFFVDTCFAGNVVGSKSGALANTSRELGRLASELASAENGVVVFASSSGRQQSEEKDEWGNGAFTKALIDGLAGKADLTRTGRVTFKGLDFFVSEEVRRLTDGRQTPVTISPVGVPDFMLAQI